ncbi:MAG: flavin-dependent monooxygenase QhpG [Solirubrobacterales bacterium]
MAGSALDIEVCVVGGGPAGSTLACRLATMGYETVLVERHPFPRPHVGEAISPGTWALLEMLGARSAVEAAGFPRAVEARVLWGAPEVRRPLGEEPGIGVDRGTFDELLLERAKEAGATVLQPAVARRPTPTAEGWELPVLTESGPLVVGSRFLADASGRARLLGGSRRSTAPRMVALHALWDGSGVGRGQTLVEAQPESWLWGTHLPGGSFRAMAFLQPELLLRRRREGRTAKHLYRELLLGSSLFRSLAAEGWMKEEAGVCDATCYVDDDPIGETWAKVGEAGFAIDPLSSSGVQAAIQAGIAASVAIDTILAGGDADAATAYFREHQRHAVENHARLAAESYRGCAAHAAETFWRRLAEGPPPLPVATSAAPLEDLLPKPVRLSPGADLPPTPCVVNGRVELRRALSHPSLPRAVAYLGGVELAPLLDRLSPDRSLSEVVEEWSRSLPAASARTVAGWLATRGLLVAAA